MEVLFSCENMFWSLLIKGIIVFFRKGVEIDVGVVGVILGSVVDIEFVEIDIVGCDILVNYLKNIFLFVV